MKRIGLYITAILLPAALARGAIITGPYVQNAGPDVVVIMWETDTAGNSYVDYGPTAAYGSTAGQADSVTIHEVEVTGLSADTIYHYRSRTGGAGSDDFTFKTAPVKGTADFAFFAYGDSRTNEYIHAEVAQCMRLAGDDRRTVILNSGDIVSSDSSPASVWREEFFGPLHDMISKTPIYVGIGNHEDTNVLFQPYLSPPSGSGSEYYYSFDYGNVHFVVLNTNIAYDSGSAQHTWLQSDLTSASGDADTDWIVVCFHHPPFSTGSHGSNTDVRAALHPVFQTYGVDIVFNGHDHCYERTDQDGIIYIITGGGGAGLYGQANPGDYEGSDIFVSCHHFCSISVSETRLEVSVHTAGFDGYRDGELLDSVVITDAGEFGPSAVAHPDRFVTTGSPVTLDGSASFDPDGDAVSYQWAQVSGPGVTLSSSTAPQPSFTPSLAGRYVFQLVTTAGGVSSIPDTVTVVADDASTTEVTLNPVADTWVSSGAPDTNYGSAAAIEVDGEANNDVAYLRFDVPAPPAGKTLLYAYLRLHCVNDSDHGGYLRTASDTSWTEGGLTYNNRPLPDSLIVGNFGAVAAGSDHDAEVTGAVSGTGPVTLILIPGSGNGADYSSKEGANAPELHLIYNGDTEPPVVDAEQVDLAGTVDDTQSPPPVVTVDGTDHPATGGTWTATDLELGSTPPRNIQVEARDASSNTRTVDVTITW